MSNAAHRHFLALNMSDPHFREVYDRTREAIARGDFDAIADIAREALDPTIDALVDEIIDLKDEVGPYSH